MKTITGMADEIVLCSWCLTTSACIYNLGGGGGGGALALEVFTQHDAGQNFQCRGILRIWIIVGRGPTSLAVGVGVVWTFFLLSIISLFFLPLSGRQPDID